MNHIRNIIFDLGGVLVDLDIERCREAFRAIGMPQVADLLDPYYPAELLELLERGDISAHEACERMRTLCNRPDISDEQIAEAYRHFLLGIPLQKLQQIKSLRNNGFRIYMLSNTNQLVVPYIREKIFTADGLTMDDYFDYTYLSCELGALKPGEEIFHKMVAHGGMKPEESLFIDDGAKNVATARALGFETHHAVPAEDFSPLFAPLLK